jgi:hypothetical protein
MMKTNLKPQPSLFHRGALRRAVVHNPIHEGSNESKDAVSDEEVLVGCYFALLSVPHRLG